MPDDMNAQALDLFTSSASRLASIAAGLNPTQLDYTPAPGDWSIRQVIHHLTDDCDVWSMILKKALDAQNCPIQEFSVRKIVQMLAEHIDTVENILAKASHNH